MIFEVISLLFCTFVSDKDHAPISLDREPFIPGKRGFYVEEKGLLSLTKSALLYVYIVKMRRIGS